MRIYLFLILVYAACHASKTDLTARSNVQVHGNQLMNGGRMIRIRTSQSGQQQLYKACGIPRMIQYPKVCNVGKDLRHCDIQSAFYHPVSKSGRTIWVPVAPCESNQKPLLTLGDFAVFDKDGSGFVDTRELITASRVADEADGLFSTSDLNKDGFMDMCEFSKFPESWKKILDKIRYFYFIFKIPENTFSCIEFTASFSAVQNAENITDTFFVAEMEGTPTTINMLKEEDQTFKTSSILKHSTARIPRTQMGDRLITDATDNISKLLFSLYTDTIPTKGTSELHDIPLTTTATVDRRKSPPPTETGTNLARFGMHITTHANDRTGDGIIENRSNAKNTKMTTETISKPYDWHFASHQRLSTMPTGTAADTNKTDVSPATELNIRDTQENESYSFGGQTLSMELAMTSTVTSEIEVKRVSKMSSKENERDDTKIDDSDNNAMSSFALYTNQRDKYAQDTKTEYQGTTVAQPTEFLASDVPEKEIRQNEMMMNQLQHITNIMTNSSMILPTVSYDNITDIMAHSTLDMNTTVMPNKEKVAFTIISNQYSMVPEDDRSAIKNFPIPLATEHILGHRHHQDDANMDTLDTYAKQPSTYESVSAQGDTDNDRATDTRSLVSVGTQPDVPITYKGKENITQEQLDISETTYARMENEELERHSLQVDHMGELWSVSTKRTIQENQFDVVTRDNVYKNKELDKDLSGKNETKKPYMKIEPYYLDRDSIYAQDKMMNGMKAIRAYNMYWFQRHDRPGFQYRNRPPFMTYPRPQLTSFNRDTDKRSFAPGIQNKPASFIPAITRYRPGIGINDQTKGTTDKLGLQTSAVDKSNQHLIGQTGAQGNKDHLHAINENKNTNSLAKSFLSKTIEQTKNGFPRPKKHKVHENGIYAGIGSSFAGKYTSKTFPNIARAPEKTPEKTKPDVPVDARSKINSEIQHKTPQPKKGLQKMATFQPTPQWTKSFEFNVQGTKEIYFVKNGDSSAEELIYPDMDVDSDELSD